MEFSPHAMTDRLLVWREQALCAGRVSRAEALLFLAWRAYDWTPARRGRGRVDRSAAPE
jgi:hypothetical protein